MAVFYSVSSKYAGCMIEVKLSKSCQQMFTSVQIYKYVYFKTEYREIEMCHRSVETVPPATGGLVDHLFHFAKPHYIQFISDDNCLRK